MRNKGKVFGTSFRDYLPLIGASALWAPVLTFFDALSELVQPTLMARIVNQGIIGGERDVLITCALQMAGFAVVGCLAGAVSIRVATRSASAFGAKLRSRIYRKILALSCFDAERFGAGSLTTRLTSDASTMQQFVQASLRVLVRSPLMLAGGIIMATTLDAGLVPILFALIPILAIILIAIFHRALPLFVATQAKLDVLNATTQENLAGMLVVKAFVQEHREERRFAEANAELCAANLRANEVMVALMPLMMLVMNVGVIAVVWFGGIEISHGSMRIGGIMAYTNYLTQILFSLLIMSFVLMSFARVQASYKRIRTIFATEPGIEATDATAGYRVGEVAIEFSGVCYTYPGSTAPALADISFAIKSGETFAIVGRTGSGKSTLINLIPRLADATAGEVRIHGTDVEELDPCELRTHVALAMQSTVIFSGTIAENITWGTGAGAEDIERAARIACADEFVSAMEARYDSPVGERGALLSGGQKQRIGLARAIARTPDILILDDCTSAVDARTARAIRDNLEKYRAEGGFRTLVVISQNADMILSSDRALVLADGKAEAIGTHDELINASPTYKRFIELAESGGEVL